VPVAAWHLKQTWYSAVTVLDARLADAVAPPQLVADQVMLCRWRWEMLLAMMPEPGVCEPAFREWTLSRLLLSSPWQSKHLAVVCL